jgi:signal transduction histidine kinase
MSAKLTLLAVAGLLAGVGAFSLATNGAAYRPTEPSGTFTLIVGASLFVSGLLSWQRRPDNRLGPLMVCTGFAWFASLLVEAHAAWLFTVGEAVQYLFVAGFIYILLSFPSGRLRTTLDRGLVAVAIVLAFGFQLAAMLFGDQTGLRCSECPSNVMRVVANDRRAGGILDLQRIFGAALALAVISLVVARWARASRPERRAAAPVLFAGSVALAALIGTIVNDETGSPFNRTPSHIFFYAFAAVPIAVLVVFLQRRLARGVVAGLVVELGEPTAPADLRAALARALGDPSLELAFWLPAEARYVDSEGRPVVLDGESERRSTVVERDGKPIAALLHDPALEHDAELVRSVCAAAALALENERLHAELRAQLGELQASRARLVEATDAERRRIERDLHDGTQQRLVSIAMSLGLLESKLPEGSAETPALVRETRHALALALEELRELTQGIHPTLLAERGLAAALDELCRRAALPVQLELRLDTRLPDQMESAAYFFASEALANAAKHSHAAGVRVRASSDGQTLTVEVADDGIGGAASGGGSGLRGLTDRVEALGGRMTISSPPGRGTTLRAEIPCA